jgi:ribose/xylose/arabinose/galactoside ABC-type transport system permease subunit
MFILSRQVAFFTLIARAQAVCLVVGGMNLSVGAIGSICTVVLGVSLNTAGLSGGVISPYGILMGGIIYTLIRHGLIEMKANPYYMNVYIGILILLTIAIDRLREQYGTRR